MLLFLIGAVRGIVEMLGWCLIAQGVLYFLAGANRERNPIYRLFALLTRAPRRLVRLVAGPRPGEAVIGLSTFLVLFMLWIGLAMLRKSL